MKVLLFTHEQDVDGLGCASLAETAKIEYKLVLSKTFELDEKINTTLDKEDISSYDKIIVTDLCPKEETLKMIAKDETLKFYTIIKQLKNLIVLILSLLYQKKQVLKKVEQVYFTNT